MDSPDTQWRWRTIADPRTYTPNAFIHTADLTRPMAAYVRPDPYYTFDPWRYSSYVCYDKQGNRWLEHAKTPEHDASNPDQCIALPLIETFGRNWKKPAAVYLRLRGLCPQS